MLNSPLTVTNESSKHCNSVSYNGIDLVKFICAILVCSIHIAPFSNNAAIILKYFNFGIQKYIARLAVPFFFICSGFFLFLKTDTFQQPNAVIKNYSFKLIRLFGLWSILLAHSETYHLWYMGSTVVAITIIALLLRLKLHQGQLIAIAAGLYVVGLLGDSYYGFTEKLIQFQPIGYLGSAYDYFFSTTRNGLFMGVPFVLIGMLFARGKMNLKPALAIIGFLLSMLLLFCEVFFLKHFGVLKNYNMYIFLIPATVFLFAFASQLKLRDKPIYKTLRAAGVLIYFSHLLVYKFVRFGVVVVRKIANIDLSSYRFWITLPIVTGLAFLLVYLSRKKNFQWLSRLYS